MIAPSKKAISVIIITTAFVVFIIIGFGIDKNQKILGSVDNLVAGEKIVAPENPNWQKELEDLSVKNINLIETGDETNPNTVTGSVSLSLASNILNLKQSNSLTEESALGLVNQSIDFIQKTTPQIKEYGRSDLNIIPNNGLISIKQYGENLGSIIKANRPASAKNEIDVINLAVANNSSSPMNELDPIIITYEKITEQFLKMPVPETFVKAHLDIVNGLRGISISLREMKKTISDPMIGISSTKVYSESIQRFARAMSATVEYIKSNKVIYEQGTGGYFLLQGI